MNWNRNDGDDSGGMQATETNSAVRLMGTVMREFKAKNYMCAADMTLVQ